MRRINRQHAEEKTADSEIAKIYGRNGKPLYTPEQQQRIHNDVHAQHGSCVYDSLTPNNIRAAVDRRNAPPVWPHSRRVGSGSHNHHGTTTGSNNTRTAERSPRRNYTGAETSEINNFSNNANARSNSPSLIRVDNNTRSSSNNSTRTQRSHNSRASAGSSESSLVLRPMLPTPTNNATPRELPARDRLRRSSHSTNSSNRSSYQESRRRAREIIRFANDATRSDSPTLVRTNTTSAQTNHSTRSSNGIPSVVPRARLTSRSSSSTSSLSSTGSVRTFSRLSPTNQSSSSSSSQTTRRDNNGYSSGDERSVSRFRNAGGRNR